MNGKEIADFLRKYDYSYHFKDSIHYFKIDFISSWPKLILGFVILIVLNRLTVLGNNEDVLSTGLLVGIEVVAFIAYSIIILWEKTYSLEFDLSKRLLRLIPRSEFASKKEIPFADVINVDVEILEVANRESPFDSYKIFSKRVKIETKGRSFPIIEISNKSDEIEQEILTLKSLFKKWLQS